MSSSYTPRYIRIDFSDDEEPTSSYYAYPDAGYNTRPTATAQVVHRPERTSQTVVYDHNGGGVWLPSIDYDTSGIERTTVPYHESGLIRNPAIAKNPDAAHDFGNNLTQRARENDQLELFHHIPRGRSTVESLYSDETTGSKIHAMTLLGLADMHSRAETGQPLAPSRNLSSHSMRIVRHLADVGAIPEEQVPSSTLNRINFSNARDILAVSTKYGAAANNRESSDVTHEARAAKRHVSKMLRPEKPKPEAEKHTQLSLPLEDY